MPGTVAFDRSHTDDLMRYIAASPSSYHAVAEAGRRLAAAGFRRVAETDAWDDEPGGRYLTRGGAILAWYVPEGARRDPARGFRVFGGHTDATGFRVKPRPDTGAFGWRQVAVEIYGGPVLHTWLDRDLGIAGRLVTRDGGEHLVVTDRPVLRVPQLAIHLDRGVNEKFTLDRQRHVTPIWGLGTPRDGELIAYLAEQADLPAADVTGWDLALFDTAPPAYLGRDGELLAAARLDNLLSVHAGISALISAVEAGLPDGAPIPVVAGFDHEECGSDSDTGAGGALLETLLRRLVANRGGDLEAHARALAASVCLSSDVGHAVHPNYPEKHEPGHHPMPNGGPILKVNVNQRYTTDGRGRAIWARACERAKVQWQTFVSNNSVPCGSTIGPITSTRLGITTLDVGCAILSMHSARELAGADDPYLLAAATRAFLSE